jgi:hypothetical protein
MKLSLLLLSLLPLFVQARHHREASEDQREQSKQQHVRRVQQLPEVSIVSCAGDAIHLDPGIPLHTLLLSVQSPSHLSSFRTEHVSYEE